MIIYSIIKKSQLEGALRLDAEYYQPEYLEMVEKISANGYRLSKLIEFIRHPAEIERIYQDEGFPYLLTQNIKGGDFVLEFRAEKFISEDRAKRIWQNKLSTGDIVMTRTGANYGDSAIYYGEPKNLLASAHILIIRPNVGVSSEYLASYFNSEIGRKLINRGVYGGLQPEITPDYLKSVYVPIINKKKQNEFKKIINYARIEKENSKRFYAEAEDLLLEELGLKDFENEENLFSIVNLSDVKSAGRMDAEYFQSKFNTLLAKVKTEKLGNLVSMIKGIEIGADAYQENGKLFIRVSSVSREGIIDKDQKYLSDELYQKLKKDFEPKVGEILLTKDATPGVAYVLKEPVEGIIAGGILKLKPKENIEPEFLALCISSIIGKSQVERDAGGSVIAHWKSEQIKNLQIPILAKATQQKITELVKKSHEARKKAKELLEEAKTKVEQLIEKN